MANPNFTPTVSTNEIYVKQDQTKSFDEVFDAVKADVDALKGGGGTVAPLATIEMHLGRLDNISGAEVSATNRICSDSFPVTVGKSYWLTNTKGVNMYALLYDADEMFIKYLGSIPSGQEIPITEPGAAYIKFSSLVGENDLSNVFTIYDTDPTIVPDDPNSSYTKAEADGRFAPISHVHTADEVTFTDGETFQQKFDAGALTGPAGADGAQGPAGTPSNMRVQNGIVQFTTDGGNTWANAKSIWG